MESSLAGHWPQWPSTHKSSISEDQIRGHTWSYVVSVDVRHPRLSSTASPWILGASMAASHRARDDGEVLVGRVAAVVTVDAVDAADAADTAQQTGASRFRLTLYIHIHTLNIH